MQIRVTQQQPPNPAENIDSLDLATEMIRRMQLVRAATVSMEETGKTTPDDREAGRIPEDQDANRPPRADG